MWEGVDRLSLVCYNPVWRISMDSKEMGRRGQAARRQKLGEKEYLSDQRERGARGGRARKEQGTDYAELGRRGAAKRWGKKN